MSGFLEEVALVADIDSLDEDSDYVVLMTLHSAKGLEFPQVYLAGMEDGLFPSYMSIASDNPTEEIEEERRLCYVGITRAKENLAVTCARLADDPRRTQYNRVSRFVKEIPSELLAGTVAPERKNQEEEQNSAGGVREGKERVPRKTDGIAAAVRTVARVRECVNRKDHAGLPGGRYGKTHEIRRGRRDTDRGRRQGL